MAQLQTPTYQAVDQLGLLRVSPKSTPSACLPSTLSGTLRSATRPVRCLHAMTLPLSPAASMVSVVPVGSGILHRQAASTSVCCTASTHGTCTCCKWPARAFVTGNGLLPTSPQHCQPLGHCAALGGKAGSQLEVGFSKRVLVHTVGRSFSAFVTLSSSPLSPCLISPSPHPGPLSTLSSSPLPSHPSLPRPPARSQVAPASIPCHPPAPPALPPLVSAAHCRGVP